MNIVMWLFRQLDVVSHNFFALFLSSFTPVILSLSLEENWVWNLPMPECPMHLNLLELFIDGGHHCVLYIACDLLLICEIPPHMPICHSWHPCFLVRVLSATHRLNSTHAFPILTCCPACGCAGQWWDQGLWCHSSVWSTGLISKCFFLIHPSWWLFFYNMHCYDPCPSSINCFPFTIFYKSLRPFIWKNMSILTVVLSGPSKLILI